MQMSEDEYAVTSYAEYAYRCFAKASLQYIIRQQQSIIIVTNNSQIFQT